MSTQTENPVNGNVSELIKEINATPKMNDGSNGCIEEKICNGFKSAGPQISPNVLLEAEKCQENKENEIMDKLADYDIITNTEQENISNGPTKKELKDSKTTNDDKDAPTNCDDHFKLEQNDVDEFSLQNTNSEKVISTNEPAVSEIETPVTEISKKNADIENIANSPSNDTLDEEQNTTKTVSENIQNEPETLNSGNQISHSSYQEPKHAETDNHLKTSVELANLITSNDSVDIEMAEISTKAIDNEKDSLIMQKNDIDDTKTEPEKSAEVISTQIEILKEVVNSDLPQTNSTLVSNDDKVEINTSDIEPKEVTDATPNIDEKVLETAKKLDVNSSMNNDPNVVNESMELDSEEANVGGSNSIVTEATESKLLKDTSTIVDIDQNIVDIDDEKGEATEKGNKTHVLQNVNAVKNCHDELVNSEKDNINITQTESIEHSTIMNCNDRPVETKSRKEEDLKVIGGILAEKKTKESVIICDDIDTKDTSADIQENNNSIKVLNSSEISFETNQEKVDITDEDDVKIVEKQINTEKVREEKESSKNESIKTLPVVCKLSNTLDILSDEEEEAPKNEASNVPVLSPKDKPSLNVDEDDDVMVIEEESDPKESNCKEICDNSTENKPMLDDKIDLETGENQSTNITDLMPKTNETEVAAPEQSTKMDTDSTPETEKISEETINQNKNKPLLPQNFLKTAKKNLAGMSRHELEDFCILRIVESIVDRSNLSDIKTKIKTMSQNLEEYRKKALLLTKQNRDLQVVLKSVQEEQKKRPNGPIQPLKITRSVGMQVLMNDKMDPRRKAPMPMPTPTPTPPLVASSRPVRSTTMQNKTKPLGTPQNIPVPRKVPVSNSPAKTLSNAPANPNSNQSASPSPVAMRNPSPVQKAPEKRKHAQSTCSVTVDLTDDEPPAKNNKHSNSPPVRVVPAHNLLAQNRQLANNSPALNSPRKVYIPISGPQALRPQQQVVLKNTPGPRQRMIAPKAPSVRPKHLLRHPAPLPDAMKQYTPPNWKNLPPAPDLKLSKVENGIVISWKIDGYPDGAYETIASYQLYAYQETSAPPNTTLWKKIGDVKALPLPMACTLTQFMAGYKYYFAVRAVDIRSRLGPFSLPGSILLLNKV